MSNDAFTRVRFRLLRCLVVLSGKAQLHFVPSEACLGCPNNPCFIIAVPSCVLALSNEVSKQRALLWSRSPRPDELARGRKCIFQPHQADGGNARSHLAPVDSLNPNARSPVPAAIALEEEYVTLGLTEISRCFVRTADFWYMPPL